MFGNLTAKTAGQMCRAFDFAAWAAERIVFVAQSGTLRVEAMLRQAAPDMLLRGSDTCVLPVALGMLAAGKSLDFRFAGKLAFIEDALGQADYLSRCAALLYAQGLARYKAENDYSRKHWRHLSADAEAHIAALKITLSESVATLALDGFAARSTQQQAEDAIAAGGAFVGYFAGKQQASPALNFVDSQVDWARPAKDGFTRRDIPELLDSLERAGLPHAVATDSEIEGRTPIGASLSGMQRVYLYGTARGSTYQRDYGRKDSYAYDTVVPARITERTRCVVAPVTSAFAQYVRQLHIAKNITLNATGQANFAVLLDGAVAGILIYSPADYKGPADRTVYLLSDITVSQQARLSKLVSMLAASREVLDMVERRLVQRVDTVLTTARSDHPVSMKYRGIFELAKRRDATPPETGFILQYQSAAKPLTVQKTFRQWWVKYGKAEIAALQPR